MDIALHTVLLIAATALFVLGAVLGQSRFKQGAVGRAMPLVIAAGAVLLVVT